MKANLNSPVAALVLKDMLVLQKQGHATLYLLIFFVLYSIVMKTSAFMITMAVVISVMLPISAFAYDDLAKWDRYALALPITRQNLVLARYVFGLIVACAGGIIGALAVLGAPLFGDTAAFGEHMLTLCGALLVAVVFLSIMFPLIYRFGVERSRLFVILVLAVPSIVVYALFQAGVPLPSEAQLKALFCASPFLAAGILYLSFLLSVKVYATREL